MEPHMLSNEEQEKFNAIVAKVAQLDTVKSLLSSIIEEMQDATEPTKLFALHDSAKPTNGIQVILTGLSRQEQPQLLTTLLTFYQEKIAIYSAELMCFGDTREVVVTHGGKVIKSTTTKKES